MLSRMEPLTRPTFSPAGAGGLLIGTTVCGIGVGALVGWAAGNTGYGLLAGAVAGVPAGVFAVYKAYEGAFR